MLKSSSKSIRALCTVAGGLLIVMGIFHGSGINYVNGLVQESDVSQLVKRVFPVLFILPSFQLIGLGIIGLLASKHPVRPSILLTLSLLVMVDAVLAFWLNALLPGIVLFIPCLLYGAAAWNARQNSVSA
jgi:hypothetical protein